MRFTVPFWSKIAIVGEPEDELPELHRRVVTRFPENADRIAASKDKFGSADAIRELEATRAKGFEFLLFPDTAVEWLHSKSGFREYLESNYRLVVNEEDGCTIFSLAAPDEDLAKYTPPDGLPLPPPELIALVAGPMNPRDFYPTGAEGVGWIREALRTHGARIEDRRSILDFGCGCGRVMRHWKSLRCSTLHGTDYNPYLIRWCRVNLPFATFSVNALEASLDYPGEAFDFIYSLSVFTHLDEKLQLEWMRELRRVLEPGGLLLLTVLGAPCLDVRKPSPEEEERERLQAGELLVFHEGSAGLSSCAAYHPEEYIRNTLAKDFELVDIVPGLARDLGGQDVVLLRKTPSD